MNKTIKTLNLKRTHFPACNTTATL